LWQVALRAASLCFAKASSDFVGHKNGASKGSKPRS